MCQWSSVTARLPRLARLNAAGGLSSLPFWLTASGQNQMTWLRSQWLKWYSFQNHSVSVAPLHSWGIFPNPRPAGEYSPIFPFRKKSVDLSSNSVILATMKPIKLSEELKPCPFCGNDKPSTYKDGDVLHGPSYVIHCHDCMTQTVDYTPEMLTKKWNNRPKSLDE